ncbi:OmpA family protein [Lysobacter sp. D1-1-M9]|uniref:OmpA family protein n=1 Tax=Novilysobacter longmucuonensis TaxID=3098603 RepID=UPI0039831E80
MKKKLLCAALLGGLSLAGTAGAQEFDDRWYLTGSTGFNLQASERGTDDAPLFAVGLGRYISPTWSFDVELNHQNPSLESDKDLNWSQYGVSLDLRRHFLTEGRGWNPYGLVGLGYQRAEEEFDNFPSPDSPGERESGNLAAKIGVGMQSNMGRVGVRTELTYRADFDGESVNAPDDDWFGDLLATVGLVIPLGPEPAPPAPPPPPPPAPPSCADLDDDGDGVNNCDDRCPDSQAGQTIGPDGCPVPVSIDLKGVNFDFDRSQLRPDAVAILGEAVQILQRYQELRVEVAGHTDLCGTDTYNQGLSERRASAVYEFLTSNGIDASRMSGPTGYGESRPLEPTPQTMPECRSETNRRTELNVQN